MANGLIQYVCGLKLLAQAGPDKDEVSRLWSAAPGMVSHSIQVSLHSRTLFDGNVQTYFGLTLMNSCSDTSFVGGKNSIHIQSRNYVGLGGKNVTYCGPTLSSISTFASSADPNTGNTQIQPPSDTVGDTVTTGTATGAGKEGLIKGRSHISSSTSRWDDVRMFTGFTSKTSKRVSSRKSKQSKMALTVA